MNPLLLHTPVCESRLSEVQSAMVRALMSRYALLSWNDGPS